MPHLARIVRLAGAAVIALLVARIGIDFLDVSTRPGVVDVVHRWSTTLAGPFDDVFLPADLKLRLALNSGFAAVLYGMLASLVAYLVMRADALFWFLRDTRRGA
jgi:hypothetical protein